MQLLLTHPRFLLAAGWFALVAACQSAQPLYPPTASPEIREACTLTERRCTTCHDLDRVVSAHKSRDEWPILVERMRQMPGSTIRPDETDVILRCLLDRTDSSGLQPRGDHIANLASWFTDTQ